MLTMTHNQLSFSSFFEAEAISQMKDLPIRKKQKAYIAEKLMNELSKLMSKSEMFKLLESKNIKWIDLIHRYQV